MKRRPRLILAVVVLGLFNRGIARAELRAGAAKVEISPPMGVSLDGPISKNGPVKSNHDPLHARALVVDDGETRLAIVVVDQCMTGRDVFDAAKEEVRQAIQLPSDRMLMAATHTHSAPRTVHIGRAPIDDEYHARLAGWIAEAVIAANRNLAPAMIGFASFDKPQLLACRRFLCEPDTVQANPFGISGERIKSVSGRSTSVIGPAGPTDPQFSIVSVQHTDGSPLCVLGNFSVHYCGGTKRGEVSADYFGYFCEAVEAELSGQSQGHRHPPVVGMMSNGTSGNTGSFQSAHGRKFAPFEGMKYYGRLLAEETLASIQAVEYRQDIELRMVESEIDLDLRRPSPDRLQWAKRVLAATDAQHPHRWTRVYAQEAMHLAKYPPQQSLKLQALLIGDIGITAAPCEVFAETGLALKRQSPIKNTFNMELANGYAGYLPTREQHQLGGYETWPARSSLLEIGAEGEIRSELLELLRRVASGQ